VIAVIRLLGNSIADWWRYNPFQHGAALAYYAVFALAPTLFIAIAVAGLWYGEKAAYGQLTETLAQTLRPTVASAISESLAYVYNSHNGVSATVWGGVLLLVAVTSLFLQLQTSLNVYWGVTPRARQSLWAIIRNRLFAFLVVVGLGLLLLLLLLTNALLVMARQNLPDAAWADSSRVRDWTSWVLLWVLSTCFFAMIYRLLPDAVISWLDTLIGAALTALLLLVGNYLIGYYLGSIAPALGYWAANSLVVIMLWTYYSSLVLLFGAALTKNLAQAFGRPVRPTQATIYQS
jgi:membrane protein